MIYDIDTALLVILHLQQTYRVSEFIRFHTGNSHRGVVFLRLDETSRTGGGERGGEKGQMPV